MQSEKDYFLLLLDKYLQNTLSVDEQNKLESLLAAHPEYRSLYAMLNSKEPALVDVDVAYQKQLSKINVSDQPKTINLWNRYLKIAASIVLVGLLSYFAIYQFGSSSEQIYKAANGSKEFVKLADGTEVWLNGGSSLAISTDFNTKDRRVTLIGEGYFHVAKDAARPFYVQTQQAQIKVLGTSFNVRSYPEEEQTETILLEGKVELSAAGTEQAYVMAPGDKIAVLSQARLKAQAGADQGRIENQGNLAIVFSNKELGKIDQAKEIQWRSNKLAFDNEPMPLVFSKLEKWYNINIKSSNKLLNQSRFSGYFDDVPIEDVLKMLKETGNIQQYSKTGQTYIIE